MPLNVITFSFLFVCVFFPTKTAAPWPSLFPKAKRELEILTLFPRFIMILFLGRNSDNMLARTHYAAMCQSQLCHHSHLHQPSHGLLPSPGGIAHTR